MNHLKVRSAQEEISYITFSCRVNFLVSDNFRTEFLELKSFNKNTDSWTPPEILTYLGTSKFFKFYQAIPVYR